jgi:hypothetical protein
MGQFRRRKLLNSSWEERTLQKKHHWCPRLRVRSCANISEAHEKLQKLASVYKTPESRPPREQPRSNSQWAPHSQSGAACTEICHLDSGRYETATEMTPLPYDIWSWKTQRHGKILQCARNQFTLEDVCQKRSLKCTNWKIRAVCKGFVYHQTP